MNALAYIKGVVCKQVHIEIVGLQFNTLIADNYVVFVHNVAWAFAVKDNLRWWTCLEERHFAVIIDIPKNDNVWMFRLADLEKDGFSIWVPRPNHYSFDEAILALFINFE